MHVTLGDSGLGEGLRYKFGIGRLAVVYCNYVEEFAFLFLSIVMLSSHMTCNTSKDQICAEYREHFFLFLEINKLSFIFFCDS